VRRGRGSERASFNSVSVNIRNNIFFKIFSLQFFFSPSVIRMGTNNSRLENLVGKLDNGSSL
jgi:hypothetical protein